MKIALVFFCLVVVAVNANRFICDVTKVYEENKCNRCACFKDSRGAVVFRCTLKACSGKTYDLFRKCNPAVPLPCDKCWCIQPYGIICEVA
ncbi:hypothetical protein RN001_015508 [Aquatica leii]|uniref:Uncharacterized protein n=1 Tax=Aquatica leii TaxID=1421715 RepID=A0AAN7SDE9_9COLE|nr:hypothetical protein RN001_015508 [Aquatica leii]